MNTLEVLTAVTSFTAVASVLIQGIMNRRDNRKEIQATVERAIQTENRFMTLTNSIALLHQKIDNLPCNSGHSDRCTG